jgi:polyhydroxyalkanoate synthesis regulator phasin
MDPITIISIINASLTLVEQLTPQVKELFQKGDITAEQQKALLDRYNALKANIDAEFSGPEWQIEK